MSDPRSQLDTIPAGLIEAVVEALRRADGPMRRRPLLDELARRGHRISLAGLNRVLEHARLAGLTTEGPDGIRPAAAPTGAPSAAGARAPRR